MSQAAVYPLSACAQLALSLGLVLGLNACNLEQELELDLPEFRGEPLVECFLSPGQPFSLLLTQSAGYFDEVRLDTLGVLHDILLNGAEVSIRYGDERVQLVNAPFVNPLTRQVGNYVAPQLVPYNYQDSFYLEVNLPSGRGRLLAATKLLAEVPMDSNVVEFPLPGQPRENKARLVTYLTDPDAGSSNYFRKILRYDMAERQSLRQDFVLTDELSPGGQLFTFTFFDFSPLDTLLVLNVHVGEEFERWQTSVDAAVLSNGNPFAQPSTLVGNVRGAREEVRGTGIFSAYTVASERVVIPERE